MTEHEFTLYDRITKIQSTIRQYGEDNFYISFSGGKDSTVLSRLIDAALPDNRIPRVYADTGIEYRAIREFVLRERERDDRVHIIRPSTPIKKLLEEKGYPFKSKRHAKSLDLYQRLGNTESVLRYLRKHPTKTDWSPRISCPKVLEYQFTAEFKLRVSDKCCEYLKEKPLAAYQKESGRSININGIMRDEGGRRFNAQCMAFVGKKLKAFQPLAMVTKDWEDWFIDAFQVELCELYYPPYSFERTGCKGCPFARYLQRELDVLEELLPAERKQCELIWQPVYAEYRRIGYRLKKD